MFEFRHILYGGAIPAALAIVLALIEAGPWQRRARRRGLRWSLTAAAAAGFILGYGPALGWPKLPPQNANDWLFWGGIVFIAIGLLDAVLLRRSGPVESGPPAGRAIAAAMVRGGAVAAALLGLIYLQVEPLLRGLWARGGWTFILIAVAAGWMWWLQADRLARREDARTLVARWLLVSAAAAQLIMLSGSQSMGQAIGGMISALVGGLGVMLVLRLPSADRALLVIVVPLVAGVLVNAVAWLDPRPPAWHIAAVMLAPVLPWLIQLTPVRRWGWLRRGLIELALAALPLAAMLAAAAIEFARRSAMGGVDDYY